jgi:DNA-binding NtrC family response regulator
MRSSVRPDDHVPTSDHTLHAGLSCHVFIGDRAHTIELPLVGSIVVGRGSESDLRVSAEGVSRRHAILKIDRDAISVADMGSKNGTHVNGKKIASEQPLAHGDEVRVGDARLVIARRSPTSSAPTVLLHDAFFARLRIEVARAHAFRRELTLALVRLDRPWTDMPLASTAAGLLRPTDVLGLHDDTTIEVLLPGLDEAAGTQAVEALARSAREAGVDVRSAVVCLDRGTSAEDLLEWAVGKLASVGGASPSLELNDEPVIVDPVMPHIYDQVKRVARGAATVLVIGETGSGKELVAREIHRASRRRGKLVTVNAAALPESLVEAELFGVERGAFTGATTARAGLFEAADGGTLFLDEVGDLPLPMQAKLLRVLEDGTVRRVGAVEDRKVDVRVVAATNADLQQLCAERRFRTDLLFRLNACTFVVPPLRDRPADIRPLAEHFARRADRARPLTLAEPAARALEVYPFPGNVRELRNVIERAALLCDDPSRVIQLHHLPESVSRGSVSPNPAFAPVGSQRGADVRQDVRDFERERIEQALAASDGNLTRAAEMLGLPRKTLAYRVERLGLRAKR